MFLWWKSKQARADEAAGIAGCHLKPIGRRLLWRVLARVQQPLDYSNRIRLGNVLLKTILLNDLHIEIELASENCHVTPS